LCENENIAVANLFAFYDADSIRCDISRYYWLHDGHHNAQGYQLMADAIYLSLLQYFPKAFGTIEIPE
ncbi:MAG TPA: hypothetical protein PLM49_03910, partial [Bacteroidales bacterium]|nr:hypothetical protein [Bacteroidales bacterium]